MDWQAIFSAGVTWPLVAAGRHSQELDTPLSNTTQRPGIWDRARVRAKVRARPRIKAMVREREN